MSDVGLLREEQGSVAILTMNRPEQRNALSARLIAELGDALAAVAVAPEVRVVVVTGAGSSFCAGMDLKDAARINLSEDRERATIASLQSIADLLQQLHGLSKPTVAALNGDAFAAGAGIAMACDFIVASASARLGYPEIQRGLAPAVVMHDLVSQIGDRRARALLLSGEPIDAREAERWGMVNRVVAPEMVRGEALALAESLMRSGPRAVAATKRLLDEAVRRPPDLRGAAAVSAAVRVSEEAAEGIRAFVEKRLPSWAMGKVEENP